MIEDPRDLSQGPRQSAGRLDEGKGRGGAVGEWAAADQYGERPWLHARAAQYERR